MGSKDEYFVLAAVVCHTKEAEKSLKKLGKKVYKKFLVPHKLDEIHATHTSFPVKQFIHNRLHTLEGVEFYYLVVSQQRLYPQLRLQPNVCYNYLVGLLLEDIMKRAVRDTHVILDNHSTKVGSLNSLHEYLVIKAVTEWNFEHKFRSEFMDSHRVYGIQFADLIANSVFSHYNFNKSTLYKIGSDKYFRKSFPY